jgi:hypothetical protein
MIVLIHVLIALASVAYTTYAFFKPAKSALYTSYSLVAATLLSGSYLVASNPPVHMLQTCTTGLLYVGAVTVGLVAVHRKLASDNVKSDRS